MKLYLDCETRSTLALGKVGVDRYSRDSELLMLAYAIDDEEPDIWLPSESRMPDELVDPLQNPTCVKVAWNCQFERSIFRQQLRMDIPIAEWLDPMCIARYAGLPANLELASGFLGLGDKGKTRQGKKLIREFSKLHTRRNSGAQYFKDWNEPKRSQDWLSFQQYCKQDVVAEREIFYRLKAAFSLPDFERDIWLLDQAINERGLPVSPDYVRRSQQIVAREREQLLRELNHLTGLRNANSLRQLLPWLQARGYTYSSLDQEHVSRALNNGSQPEVREALEIRQTLARSSVAKLRSIEDRMCDGRVRFCYRYYAAHTGRWSGSNPQPQNLPRQASKWGKEEIDLRAAIRAPRDCQLVVADLSSIETVVLAWLSQCERLLKVFEEGRDPYISFASVWLSKPYNQVTRQERQISKSAVLGCGFGLGGGDVFVNADDPNDIRKSGLLGYSEKMGSPMNAREAHSAVQAYREEYFEIPGFWHGCEDAAIEAATTSQSQNYFNLRFGSIPGRLLWVKLPSGRRLHYLRPEVKEGKFARPELSSETYTAGRWQRLRLYGSKLCENLVQSIARDVLATGMLRANHAGCTSSAMRTTRLFAWSQSVAKMRWIR
jgi:DNA polymerase